MVICCARIGFKEENLLFPNIGLILPFTKRGYESSHNEFFLGVEYLLWAACPRTVTVSVFITWCVIITPTVKISSLSHISYFHLIYFRLTQEINRNQQAHFFIYIIYKNFNVLCFDSYDISQKLIYYIWMLYFTLVTPIVWKDL